jgi:hypothetical protein
VAAGAAGGTVTISYEASGASEHCTPLLPAPAGCAALLPGFEIPYAFGEPLPGAGESPVIPESGGNETRGCTLEVKGHYEERHVEDNPSGNIEQHFVGVSAGLIETWSPTIEGARAVFQRDAVPLDNGSATGTSERGSIGDESFISTLPSGSPEECESNLVVRVENVVAMIRFGGDEDTCASKTITFLTEIAGRL